MKKYLILFGSIVAVVVIVIFSIFSNENANSLCLIFVSENNLIAYDVKNEEATNIELNEYTSYYTVGPYLKGDYCCVVKKDNLVFEVLFVENNIVTNTYSLEFCPEEIISYNDTLYCLVDDDIYSVNILSDEINIVAEDIYTNEGRLNMFLSEDGSLLYLSQSEDEKGSLSLVYDNGNGNSEILCNAKMGLGFISSSTFLYKNENYATSAVNIYSGKKRVSRKYSKYSVAVIPSNDKKHVAGFRTTGEAGGFAVLEITNSNGLLKTDTTLNTFSVSLPLVITEKDNQVKTGDG